MKRYLKIFFCVICIIACVTSCSRSEYPCRYEQVGGDPQFDYIEFISDSTLRFYAPDKRILTVRYTNNDGQYKVNIAPMVSATLSRTDKTTLTGSVPFFEGTWKKNRPEKHHYQKGLLSRNGIDK